MRPSRSPTSRRRGQDFQKGHAGSEADERGKAAADVVIAQVVHDVGADDEVEWLREVERGELAEGRAAQVPLPPETFHGVLARVEAEVADAGAERPEARLPGPLAASDVENAAQAPAQEVLRRVTTSATFRSTSPDACTRPRLRYHFCRNRPGRIV